MHREFLERIGVKHERASLPLYNFSGKHVPFEPEAERSAGYIKFQSEGTDADVDRQQADQFQQWLDDRGYEYFRGYSDEPDRAVDRRFFLGRVATEAVENAMVGLDRYQCVEE